MGTNDFVTLFFLVAAVLIFLQLRSVLGRRTGNEKPPYEPYNARDMAKGPGSDPADKVVTIARRGEDGATDENRYEAVDSFAKPDTEINRSLRAFVDADPAFDPKEFVKGARMAYEMIVMAFAEGDRATLKGLLSREVYEGFDKAIADRESRGETVKSTFVGIDKIDIVQAEVREAEAMIKLKIVSQMISATYDKSGAMIDGSAEEVAEISDIWTFARDVRSRDPNWKLVATES
ncbi:Tim44/TimA family putative adaptor protein [Rhizobium sp. PAMB 3182]